MAELYEFIQPEYVNRFKCDGQKCSAKCCSGWNIYIDKKTYKKYSHVKPKRAAQELTRYITKRGGGYNDYVIRLTRNLSCPFLTEDNWCSIQKKYGEDFLSEICRMYPRRIYQIYNFYERSLTLTCPVAAELILFEQEPLKFEKLQLPKLNVSNLKVKFVEFGELYSKVTAIQKAAIAILQERTLSIDARLLILGLYCDRLAELLRSQGSNGVESENVALLSKERLEEIDKVSSIYQRADFLREQAAQFSAVIKFNAREYIIMVIGMLEALYGKDSGRPQGVTERAFIDSMAKTLQLKPDENDNIKISEVSSHYVELADERKNFVSKYAGVFENYLVNEFFMNLYPFKFTGGVNFNYGVFVTIYKVLELLAFSRARNEDFSQEDFTEMIMWYATNIDHNLPYIEKIAEYMEGKTDVVEIMQNMLQL